MLDTYRAEVAWEVRQFRRHQHLLREGQTPDVIYRLEDGWACRYQMLGANRRQITALFLPGEYCEPQWIFGADCANPIVALTSLRVSSVALSDFQRMAPQAAEIRRSMDAALLGLLNRQYEWIATLGRKTALERVCALLSDIVSRLRSNGRFTNDRCTMPLTQTDIADIVGLTPVHVNRVLKHLRAEGLLELRSKWLRLPDPEAVFGIGAGQAEPVARSRVTSTAA